MGKRRESFRTITLDLEGAGGGSCPCRVRVSERARRIRLTVDVTGVAVVVPAGFPLSQLPSILEARKEWIVKALEKTARRTHGEAEAGTLPTVVELRALDELWHVTSGQDVRTRLEEQREGSTRRLLLAPDFNRAEALTTLRRWVLQRAKEALPRRLKEVALEYDFSPARIAVKGMRSRWGSCSSAGNISLNGWLLFLPPRLVRHVFLHELCHLLELNHSKAFYECLNKMDPEAKRCASELKAAWSFVPAWICE
ncbi:MAG: M48 family metallopeptidase [Fretibacterium sp.]|nr:M48 family metallopeptidase [Fretibacterium sp.]